MGLVGHTDSNLASAFVKLGNCLAGVPLGGDDRLTGAEEITSLPKIAAESPGR